VLFLLVAAGCDREPSGVTSYEWVAPELRIAPFPLYPGASANAGQTELIRRARQLNTANAAAAKARLALYETDASLETVERYYVDLLAATPDAVTRAGGNFAADDARLAPLLQRLGQPFTPTTGDRVYRTVVIRGGAGKVTVSLQRPYRDFVRDTIVDKTSILITE
jgi:hypothetical protein